MMYEILKKYEGQRVAIWCCRYTYRGRVTAVGEEYIVLSDAYAVEVTGRATAAKTDTEDKIPGDLIISTGAVEIACQPTWA